MVRLIASILLVLAVMALPMYSVSGLACRDCPLRSDAGVVLAEVQLLPASACRGCRCESEAGAASDPHQALGQAGAEQSDDQTGEGSPTDSDPASHSCDCPFQCACGSVKVPLFTLAFKIVPAAPIVYMPVGMFIGESVLSDPHLKRLKRPPRFTGSC